MAVVRQNEVKAGCGLGESESRIRDEYGDFTDFLKRI